MKVRAAEDKLVVVRYNASHKRQRILSIAATAVVCLAVGYWLGEFQVKANLEKTVDQLNLVSKQFSEVRASESLLKQAVTNLERGKAIDEQAKQGIQNTITELNEQVSTLKKDVSFYKNIMAPSDNSKGLQVRTVEVSRGQTSESFDYKIVMAQVADNKRYIQGVVAVNIIGLNGDKREVIPLRDVSEVKELGIKFKFRYFQDIVGELVLPKGFKPERVQVVAQSKGKKASRIESSYDWTELVN